MENTYLMHHGVKGMKWGVRRTPAQLGHPVQSKKEMRAQYKADKQAAKATYKKNRLAVSNQYDTAEEAANRQYKNSLSVKERATLDRESLLKNAGYAAAGQVGADVASKAYRFKNAETYASIKKKADVRDDAINEAADKYAEGMRAARREKRTAKTAAKENYKASIERAKSIDKQNYADYKTAAKTYKKHASAGEKVCASISGHPTAYYANRQAGVSKGKAAANVFLTGNMGALSRYNVKVTVGRVYAS